MSDYIEDVKKHAKNVNEAAVDNIVKYCGIALRGKDSSLVSSSDPSELDTVCNGFAKKKLGLDLDAAKSGVEAVCARMKDTRQKQRVTFYYLLAEETNTMSKLT